MKKTTTTPKPTINGRFSSKENPASKADLLQRWSGTPAVHLAVIAVIALFAYSNTFQAPFVFDDEGSIIENPVIKNLAAFLFDGAGYRYNPRRFIGYLTIALNYRLGGLDVTGYHLFNLSVHILSAWLVYFLVRLTLQTPFFREQGSEIRDQQESYRSPFTVHRSLLPLLTALLFVAHPVQTQAVTYIVQRLASLATLFYLASMVFYVQGRLVMCDEPSIQNSKFKIQNSKFFALSLIAAILAMRTKEIAATLPLMVILYEFSFFGTSTRKKLLFLLPVLLTVLIIPLGMLQAGKSPGELLSDVSEMARESRTISRGDYLLTQFSVIATYIRLLIFPAHQNLVYDYPVFHSLFTPRVFLSLLFLIALFGVAVWLYYSSKFKVQSSTSEIQNSKFKIQNSPSGAKRLIAFGILWFFITLSVESSVIPITDVIFEHRLYLPSVGAFCAIATLFAIIALRFPPRSRALAGGVVILALALTTWERNQVWGSATGLWRDCVSKSPEKVRPYNNLANALTAEGRVDEAIEQLRIALKLEPGNASALRNLGAACEQKGWLDDAVEQYRLSLNSSPDNVYTRYNLGIVYAKKGFTDMAIEQFRIAIELYPDYADAYNNLGVALGNKGLIDEAITQFRHAIRLNPGSVDARNNLVLAYGKKGKKEEAIEEFRISAALQPDNAEVYNNMGIVYGMQGAYNQAVEQFLKAISLQPDNPKYSYNLANAYRQKLRGN